MWLTLLRPLAFLALAVGLGTGIYASSVSQPLAYYSPRPGNCTSASGCFNYCQNNPAECSRYCGIDSSHARECAGWQVVTISTESGTGSYTAPNTGSYTPPVPDYASMETACRATANCSWAGTYCNCTPTGGAGTGYTQPDYASMEASCRNTSGCSWAGTYCNCASSGGYYGSYGSSTAPTSGQTNTQYQPPATTPTQQPMGCYYSQPSEINETNCTMAVDGYVKCDPANSLRYTSRDQMIKNCLSTLSTPTQPTGSCPQINCVASQVSCDIPGDGNPCPVCTTSAACNGTSVTPTPSPTTTPTTTTSTTRAPSPPPGCAFQQPYRATVDTCTIATDNYIACYPTAQQFSSRTKMIQDCAGIRPAEQECALPRCTAIEVSCNPPNDNNPCAVCMTERACRIANETPVPKPETKPEVKPEVKPEIKPEIKPEERREEKRPPSETSEAQLAGMKKSFKEWLRNFHDTERRVKKLQSRGVTVTQEIAEAVSTIQSMATSVDAATSVEDLKELGQNLQEAVQTINESLPQLERLADFSRTLRDLDRQIRTVNSQWKRLARRAAPVQEKTSLVDEIVKQLDEAAENREAAVAAAGAGQGDDAFSIVKDVYTALDEVQEKFRALETVISAPREIARARREVSGFARDLTKLERRGIEVGKLKELLLGVRASLDLAAKLAAQKPFPVDEVVGAIQEFEDAKDSFLMERDDLLGTRKEVIPQPIPNNGPLKLPSGFGPTL